MREVEEQRERKRAQEALQESEARKKAMLESALDCIIAIDHQGKILEFNPAAERTFGYTLDQVIGKPLADLIIPSRLREKHKQGLKQYIATREGPFIGKVVEVTAMRADGTEFPAELAITSIGEKWPPMFLGHIRDITERKQVEEKMRLQSAALESAANAVVITDRDGIITWVNPAFTKLTGYSPEEAIGQNPRLLKSGTQDQPFYGNLWNTILSGRVWSGEIVNRRKDGVLYTEEQTVTPVRDAQGEVTHFIAIKQNITERKRADKERARLISVMEATTDLVGIADPQGRALYINKNGRKMVGIGEDEDISGFQVTESQPEPARKFVLEEAILTAIREGVWQGESTLLTRDGREIPVLQVILAHRAPDGSVEFLSTIIRDITERKRAEEEIQRNLERIRALHEIDKAITSTLDLRKVLDVLLEKVDQFFPGSPATVRLLDKHSGLLKPIASRNVNKNEWELRTPLHPGFAWTVLTTKAHLQVRNVQTHPATKNPAFFREHGMVSFLGVPLVAQGESLGVLSLYSKEEHEFTSDEVEFLTTLGGQAAIAIHNAELYEQAQKSLERIRALREIDRAITSTLDLQAVLDVLLEKIDRLLPYSATTVGLWNVETEKLTPVACRNIDMQEWQAIAKRGFGLPRAILETKQPVIIRNVQSDPRAWAPDFLHKQGLVSYLGIPLMVKDEALGVLGFYTKEEHDFTSDEIELLTTLARQAAIAIHNSQMYQQMANLASDLAKSNKVKEEFLSVMSHELRTPLNVVMGYTAMVRDGLLGEINPKQEDALAKILRQSNEQLAMVNNILFATVLEAQKIKVETQATVLGDLVNQPKSVYEVILNKPLELIWDCSSPLAVVNVDATKIKQILQNLIHNAIKFTEKGNVRISARVLKSDTGVRDQGPGVSAEPRPPTPGPRFVEFKVADTGIGIPKDHLPFVFERFRQVDSSETRLYGGVGVGLYIVRKFTEMLGGEVSVESEVGKGSTFTVKLPLKS
ncbi:MAG: hypothetical protein A2038_13450 [Deltaproteobacteria bacterium GWA2_57_13]|nr:MAG: hypothetical protein A2038_13450 [Deltaproteobacteria bacterium GWA2_57_13]OGQ77789.1 MAG: hypothetical protein A3G40_05565 [Deltaproteobacteria bacterium RIFCSPLOWO2_12_FULL_57_22]